MKNCVLCYITDRNAFAGDGPSRRRRVLEKINEAARFGIDYIQLREKDLATRDLESLAREAMSAIRESSRERSALLINSRTDVALAVGANGVQLRSGDLSPQDVRFVWQCGAGAASVSSGEALAGEHHLQKPVIAISCHSPAEVAQAADAAATFAVFAPVFEKKDAHAAGLAVLQQACLPNIPVLALGGVTLTNMQSCLAAGAAGIAAIRLFQENNIAAVVKQLRG